MASVRGSFPLWRSILNIQRFRVLATQPNYVLRCCSSFTGVSSGRPEMEGGSRKAENISRAMKAYLERAKEYGKFMEKEVAEYDIGRQHLARIMGINPEDFTREDIDKAVEYLLPSGLFDKKSRPMLKHPDEIVPHKIVAQFGADGRPFHYMFYTGLPKYYSLSHEFGQLYEDMKKLQVEAVVRNEQSPEKLSLVGSEWIDKKTFVQLLQEEISEHHYNHIIRLLERIADHPWASKFVDKIMEYRKILGTRTQKDDVIPELLEGENGRLYMIAEGSRKTAKCRVTVWDDGNGEVSINGKDLLTAFPGILDREQVMFPIQFTGKLGQVDFEATVELTKNVNNAKPHVGHSATAGAVRLALARALRSFVHKDTVEKMRLAGLLTRDPRMRERKKYGQEGARRKFTWKKR